jgi:hypothetical protein
MTRFLGGLMAMAIAGALLMQSARAGDVTGQVIFNGAAPKPAPIIPTNDKAFCTACEKGGLFNEELLVDPKSKGLQNVVVFLVDSANPKTPIPHPKAKEIAAEKVLLDQPCCTFVPRMVVLVEGQTLVAKNSSGVAHNTNITSPGGNPTVNPALPPNKSIEVPGWKAVGKPSSVACNIHPWMKAWIFTVPSPYFAVTDKDGKFEIKDVPAGKYNIIYWHEKQGWIGTKKTKDGDPIEVAAGGLAIGNVKTEPSKDD